MRKISLFMLLIGFISGCGGGTVPTDSNTTEQVRDTTQTSTPTSPISTLDCNPDINVLENNQLVLRSTTPPQLIAIAADSSTFDEHLGESHRVLLVYDMKACTLLHRQVLPINESADFPYELADVSFHRALNIIAIKGINDIYCFDVNEKTLFKPIQPQFSAVRESADAQSGSIMHLEVWEDFLFGYALDFGPFAFSLAADNQIKPQLPKVDYLTKNGQYHSLFLLSTTTGQQQALIPLMDSKDGHFSINPLFDTNIQLSNSGNKNRQEGRYHLLRTAGVDGKNILIDLEKAESIALPSNLLQADENAVLDWAKSNMGE